MEVQMTASAAGEEQPGIQPCRERVERLGGSRVEEDSHATIDEAALAASSLAALTGVGHEEAASALRAVTERATSRRRELRTFGTGSSLRR
jgi:hypothetical protein